MTYECGSHLVPFAPFDLILVLFSFVFVCCDLVASRRRQHIVFGRRRLKLMFAAINRIAKLVGLAAARASGEALSCSLFAEGSRHCR